jgi:hypothetical protein
MAQRLTQAYQQAPWRSQVQSLRTFFLVMVVFALVTGMYLYISAQAAMAGLNTQQGEWRREELIREIATKKNELGTLTSVDTMEKRAIALGYKPVAANKGMYVVVPGYAGRPQVNLAPPVGSDMIRQGTLKKEYTESIWELLFKTVNTLKADRGGSLQ